MATRPQQTNQRNPAWTREELILALELYLRLEVSAMNSDHPEVIALSETLNRLRSADQLDPETYRNPSGVAMKLHNFGRFDPNRHGVSLSHGNKLEAELWQEFANSRPKLDVKAAEIRSKIK